MFSIFPLFFNFNLRIKNYSQTENPTWTFQQENVTTRQEFKSLKAF